MLQGQMSFGARLRVLRAGRGMSQVELARRIGRHPTTIGPYGRDEYMPSRDIVERLAGVLDSTPEYLLFGRSAQRSTIWLEGRLGPAGTLTSDTPGQSGPLRLRDDQLAAFRLDDAAMAPVYLPGSILVALATASEQPEALCGEPAVVELADGRVLLRRLMPSADPALFDLAATHGPTLRGIVVLRARRVIGVLHPDAFAPDDTVRASS
jgi:transcriptional regulator with XRE-family HTH domain